MAEAEAERAKRVRAAGEAAQALQAAQARQAALADQRAEAAAALRGVEADVLEAGTRLTQAEAAGRRAEAALAERDSAFAALVPLLLRLSRTPPETILAVPATPDGATEGLLVARGLAVQLVEEMTALRTARAQATKARRETAGQAAMLAAHQAAQARRAVALDQMVAEAGRQVTEAEAAGRAASEAVAQSAASAMTLQGAMAAMADARKIAVARAGREASLAEQRKQPVAAEAARARQVALSPPAPASLPGRLVVPVAGTVARRFGAPAEDGTEAGLTFATAPGAFVASPCAGRVAFAAPFRSFGKLVILECGGGTDVVLAGLGRIDVVPGHPTRPGEPLGRMPGQSARPFLYFEVRSAGQPVDPAPFLTAKS